MMNEIKGNICWTSKMHNAFTYYVAEIKFYIFCAIFL